MADELRLSIEKLIYGGDGLRMPMEIRFLCLTSCLGKKYAQTRNRERRN